MYLGSEKLLGMVFPILTIGISKYFYFYFQSEKKKHNGKDVKMVKVLWYIEACEHSCSLKWPSLS
jgi:hypothetical protein